MTRSLAIRRYFGPYLKDRIDFDGSPTSPPDLLVRWQCVLYFGLIAGRAEPFGTREAHRAITRYGARMDNKTAYRDIARYLYRLCDDGFLRQRPGQGRYPAFQPTISGAWW